MTTRYYYDGQNVIAEYDESDEIQRSYVHGMQYIDERAVMRDHQVDAKAGDDQMGKDYYYLLQELYTVAGLADCRGWLAEMYSYQAYGDAQIWLWPEGDINRDGTTEYLDRGMVTSGRGKALDPLLDANLDGVVTYTDNYSMYWPDMNHTAMETRTANVGNPYMFTGRTTDTVHSTYRFGYPSTYVSVYRRLQDNRNRTYDPKHGRWLQRDPLGVRTDPPKARIGIVAQYSSGGDLYEYVRSAPGQNGDPSGLYAETATDVDKCLRMLEKYARYKSIVDTLRPDGKWGRLGPGYSYHFIFVFPDPYRTYFTYGFGVELSETRYQVGQEDVWNLGRQGYPAAYQGTAQGYQGYSEPPPINVDWLVARRWVGADTNNNINNAYAMWSSQLVAIVDHNTCTARPYKGKTISFLTSREGYPAAFVNPNKESSSMKWSDRSFQTGVGPSITGKPKGDRAPHNVKTAVDAFNETLPSVLRDFDEWAKKCIRCELRIEPTDRSKSFTWSEEREWDKIDLDDYPSNYTIRGAR